MPSATTTTDSAGDGGRLKTAALLTGDRWFESCSLQRGVMCEPDFLVSALRRPYPSQPTVRQGRQRSSPWRGTDGSNPSPSSGESANLRSRFRDDAVRATAS